ncbi:MAG: PAS domain S-box protein, partial [Pseudomonadales bacterium]
MCKTSPGIAKSVDQKMLDRLQRILGASDLLVVILDLSGRIQYFNPACERLTGYDHEDVLDQEIFGLLLPVEQRESVRLVFEQLKAGDFPNEHENIWVTREGDHRQIHWHNTAETGPDGRVSRVIGTGIDVTDQRESEHSLKTIVDYVPALIARLDLQYRFIFTNLAYKEWFGLDASEIVGRPVKEILGEAAFEILQPHFARALSGQLSVYDGEVPYA